MTKKKMTNAILDANGGLDSARALATAHDIMENHDLKGAVLYHLVFTGSQSIADYQAAIKSLIRRLRSRCRTEYFGAYEVAVDKGGLHAHCFVLIETSKRPPFSLLCVRDGKYLHKLALRHGLNRIHISKPKNRMHGGQFYARPVGAELLADCMKWVTYEFKSRSKEGVQSRETYFNSEFKSNKEKRKAKKLRSSCQSVASLVSCTAENLTSEMENLPSACSAVSDSSIPNGASALNSCARIARTTERAVACPDAISTKSSRLIAQSASAYVMRNVVMCEGGATGQRRYRSSKSQDVTTQTCKGSSSKLVPYEPSPKRQSSIVQKLLDKPYDLDHNCVTIFRPIQEPT